jgi:2-hydroxychromene-2-carboxylate isomerase
MRLIVATPADARPALSHALFRAYWVDGADFSDETTIDRIATDHGIDPVARHTAEAKQELHYRTAEAADAGVFGVPTFSVGDKIWWGQDRMHFVESALGGDPEIEPSVAPGSTANGRVLTFFHDFSSPFSYLASTQIERIAAQRGASVQWRPILLGALFKSIGTPNVPLFAMAPAKMRYVQRDLFEWSQWWGVGFDFPGVFPIRSVLALRVALQEPKATAPLYAAAWVEGRDISDPEVVGSILDAHGLDSPALVAGAQDPRIKQALRDNTAAAESAGACGVPTFQLGDVLIWGQDRLHMVAHLLP